MIKIEILQFRVRCVVFASLDQDSVKRRSCPDVVWILKINRFVYITIMKLTNNIYYFLKYTWGHRKNVSEGGIDQSLSIQVYYK